MDLKNGNIELLGTVFGKDTTPEEALENTALSVWVDDNDDNFKDPTFHAKGVILDGIKFNVDIYFMSKEIHSIRMNPIDLEMADPGYPNREYQELKKKICDAFLLRALGEPTGKNEWFTWYEYEWGEIVSLSFCEGRRDEFSAGYIEIKYKRNYAARFSK